MQKKRERVGQKSALTTFLCGKEVFSVPLTLFNGRRCVPQLAEGQQHAANDAPGTNRKPLGQSYPLFLAVKKFS